MLRVLAITDHLRDGRDGLVARTAAAVRGGATMVQLRLKDAAPRTVLEVARALLATLPSSVPLLVNDRADLALAARAAGVHLGPEDPPAAAIRRIAPRGFIIGASVGCDAEVAGAAGADYVGIGPVFGTASKADAGAAIGIDELRRLADRVGLPAVGIGGITIENAGAVYAAGIDGVAAIRAILSAPDPEAAARALRAASGR